MRKIWIHTVINTKLTEILKKYADKAAGVTFWANPFHSEYRAVHCNTLS